jgi:hypothetical protein
MNQRMAPINWLNWPIFIHILFIEESHNSSLISLHTIHIHITYIYIKYCIFMHLGLGLGLGPSINGPVVKAINSLHG